MYARSERTGKAGREELHFPTMPRFDLSLS
jgi:hypothetical protein